VRGPAASSTSCCFVSGSNRRQRLANATASISGDISAARSARFANVAVALITPR
jgi:hypothetical protein